MMDTSNSLTNDIQHGNAMGGLGFEKHCGIIGNGKRMFVGGACMRREFLHTFEKKDKK